MQAHSGWLGGWLHEHSGALPDGWHKLDSASATAAAGGDWPIGTRRRPSASWDARRQRQPIGLRPWRIPQRRGVRRGRRGGCTGWRATHRTSAEHAGRHVAGDAAAHAAGDSAARAASHANNATNCPSGASTLACCRWDWSRLRINAGPLERLLRAVVGTVWRHVPGCPRQQQRPCRGKLAGVRQSGVGEACSAGELALGGEEGGKGFRPRGPGEACPAGRPVAGRRG
mmetsp:Transcript_121594/g.343998  ORF Transcript_121594/g.343998 Transcript_121594/m.343998 type:complete len:228 (+) Transcript_121594:467-1150(+)